MRERREPNSPLAPFRLPIFRGLWTANVLSTIGGYINDIGATWLMTSLSASPLMVSLVQVASNAPFFLLALPGGALGDILDKRKLLLVTQIVMMALSALLGVLTLLGLMSPVSLLLMLFTIEVFDALAGPAWQTLIPEIVGPKEMRAAITLNSVGMNVARAVGPAMGGALLAVTTTSGSAFLVNAASFLAVIAFLFIWKRRAEPSALPAERLLGAMRVGLRFVRFAPRFRATLVRIGAFILFGSALSTLLPVIARSNLHRGPAAYGMLLGFMGAGAVGAVPILRWAGKVMKLDSLLAVATASSACAELGIGTLHHLTLLCGVMLVAGAAWLAVMSSLNSAAQSVLPAWVRARAMAVYLMVFFGSLSAGGILWGVLANWVGAPLAMIVAACGMFMTLLLIPRFRLIEHERLDLNPSLHWPAPMVAHAPPGDKGPVLVTVEYRIAAENAAEFVEKMQQKRGQLLQSGAFRWGAVQRRGRSDAVSRNIPQRIMDGTRATTRACDQRRPRIGGRHLRAANRSSKAGG